MIVRSGSVMIGDGGVTVRVGLVIVGDGKVTVGVINSPLQMIPSKSNLARNTVGNRVGQSFSALIELCTWKIGS